MSFHSINTITTGIAEYTGLEGLLSIFEHGGRYYGITATQLVELIGTDDDGTDIAAILETGKMDFSSDKIKQMDTVYMNGTSGEDVTLTVTTEQDGTETENEYTMSSWTGDLYERRTKLGRGVRSRWWKVKLENTLSGTFKVKDLKALVNPAARRIQ